MTAWLNRVRNLAMPAPQPFQSGPAQHSLPLDGVRGIAVLLVLMYDCLKLDNDGTPLTFAVRKLASCGWLGVDLFFVLSGFLITGILLETKGKVGYWKSFFIRRSVRIFPLYYFSLLSVFVLIPLVLASQGAWSDESPMAAVAKDQVWYWFYLPNWLFAVRQSWPHERVLNHFWSLAVEEQFYLVWPIIVAALSRKNLVRLCVSLAVVALGLRFALLLGGSAPVASYVMTVTRMDSLCVGAIVAVMLRNPVWYNRMASFLPVGFVTLGVVALGIDAVWPLMLTESFGAYSIGHTLFAVMFACLIGSAATLPASHPASRGLALYPLRVLGKYSYAMYVFHRFAYAIVSEFTTASSPEFSHGWALFGLTLVVTLVMAKLSWLLLEQHFLALKRYAPRPDDVVDEVSVQLPLSVEEMLPPESDRAVLLKVL